MSEVTLLTYGGTDIGEYIVFYQDGKSEQEYFKSNTLPNQEQLQTIWGNGDQIAFIAHGKHEWCTVVRKVPNAEKTPNTQQVKIVPDSDFKKLDAMLNAEFKAGRILTRIVFGEDKWVLLTQVSDKPVEQKLVLSDAGFPEAAISEHWDAGYFIKTSAYGNKKYALLFEKGDVPQSLYMDKEFPEEEIEDLWADCYSVSGLIYGDGKWVLISNEQTRNNHQGWVSDTLFPDDDLEELLCAGGLQPKLPPATQVQGICKTGWLLKKAPADWKPWKRRWFVLSAKKRTIYYYALQTDEKPKGYFFTNGCSVGVCEDASIEKKHPCTFQVAHPIRRVFYVQAPDPRTRDEWIKEIQALLDEDYARKKTEIEKFIEDIYGETDKPQETRLLEWGIFIARMKEILDVIDEKDEDALHFVMHFLADDVAKKGTNAIDTIQVARYVSAFGFVEDAHDKMQLVADAWHGIQTEATATALLAKNGNQVGQYVCWYNNEMLKVAVSFVNQKGKVEHNTISWDYSADQFFIEEHVESHDLPVVFRSIESAMQTMSSNGTWTKPVKADKGSLFQAFAADRKDFKIREKEMLAKRAAMLKAQEEAARKAEEERAAAAAASGKKSKKKKSDKDADTPAAAAEEGGKKKKRTKAGSKKKGAAAGDDGDEGGESKKGKSKGKRSKK